MSALVDRALEGAGLSAIVAARTAGDLARVRAEIDRLGAATVDLLALGALADRIRADEVGDIVRVYTHAAADDRDDADVVTVDADGGEGLAFLRALAIARITGPRASRIRVDWTSVGLELAQVALGFGASELRGTIASKRGLPIAATDMAGVGKESAKEPAALVKKRELAAFIERSGRRPVFEEPLPLKTQEMR